MPSESACLYVVATPIGNLSDLTPRAVEVLDSVDVVAAEDTRHSATLLSHAGAQAFMVSLHEHNEDRVTPELIERLQRGETVALISDAGTPLVSDPGFALVRAAREASIPVCAIPGACAAVAAISVSGLASDRFVFEGFLPSKATARRQRLSELRGETRTLVLYESSHRIAYTVRDLAETFGTTRQVCLARELTKLHEQSVTRQAAALPEWLAADSNRRRGEFVLVIAGAEPSEQSDQHTVEVEVLMRELIAVMPLSQAARMTARLLSVGRNAAYEIGLTLSTDAT